MSCSSEGVFCSSCASYVVCVWPELSLSLVVVNVSSPGEVLRLGTCIFNFVVQQVYSTRVQHNTKLLVSIFLHIPCPVDQSDCWPSTEE